jgi:hypothetical protein
MEGGRKIRQSMAAANGLTPPLLLLLQLRLKLRLTNQLGPIQ